MASASLINASEKPIRSIVIGPGDFHFDRGQTRISTLLGSCVSITLWHPVRQIGGMCHYMLCERQRMAQQALDGRYAAEAFQRFLEHAKREGTQPSEYVAKLFGGANMFTSASQNLSQTPAIGQNNIEYGRALLNSHSVPLIAEHVGGSGRRKLHFDLWSGDVWLSFPDGHGATIHGIPWRKDHA